MKKIRVRGHTMTIVAKRRTDPKLALRIARAQLRELRGVRISATSPEGLLGPRPLTAGQFIQCWAVNRGYSGITQALDTAGQVWERVSLMEESSIDGKKVKHVKESYWVRVSMTRKDSET